ncbi:MAG: pirin-like C-terminal cupin domain-containing protein, partial [Marinirhabdus sp.]|nr:pirin-like C-terminal cupin domain-containing protein [Marinirhabdus sp.]
WLNLPAEKKMMPAAYQHEKNEDFRTVTSDDQKVTAQVIAGELNDVHGRIATQTSVNAFMVTAEAGGAIDIALPSNHQGLVYLLKGKTTINSEVTLELNKDQMVWFEQDGDGFAIFAETDSKLLVLSGAPLNEKVTSWGPYVMNTQTEIMEALRDFQQGKMGYLPS